MRHSPVDRTIVPASFVAAAVIGIAAGAFAAVFAEFLFD
jgi:hypothetical protein